MGLRPTNSDENHVGRASTPAAGLHQTRLFPNRLRWVFDCAAGVHAHLFRCAKIESWRTRPRGHPDLEVRPTTIARPT